MFKNPILNDLVKKYREKKLAHAYLIETNDYDKVMADLKTIIEILNCTGEYHKDCSECNLCNLIMKNNLPSLKIIEPDGSTIKKSQIEELKSNFSTIPVYSKYNIYIIKNAEKLNASSANSMLKFLEEPTDGIIGFFITNNKDVMMDTIKSRCQSLNIKYAENNLKDSLNLTEEEYENYINIIKDYLKKLNNNELIMNKKDVLTTFCERSTLEKFLKIIFQIYYQNFLRSINKEYDEKIVNIYKSNGTSAFLINKLNIISSIINELSYNVNMEQILDKFVIEMRDSNG